MKVEIRFTREGDDTQDTIKEALEKLSDSYCPIVALLNAHTDESGNKSCFWEGTLDQLNQIVEIRESYGKDPNRGKMYNDYRKVFGWEPLDLEILKSHPEPMKA